MMVSAPAKRLVTNVVTELTMTSSSPASSACMAIGLELMLMISASTPSFFNNPFSWTTQIGLAAGFIPVQPILVFSCALVENEAMTMQLMVRTIKKLNSMLRLMYVPFG